MPDDQRRRFDAKEAPHSRLFIIGSKSLEEADFKNAFDPFGTIEDIFVVKDRNTGENKGIAYVKFAKTSEAARALEALHGHVIGNVRRPLKVMIASKPEEGNREVDFEEISHRLFVVVPRDMSDDDLYDAFNEFGSIQYAKILRDRNTKESKGVAYVKFSKFSEAAAAYEHCDRSFKAVFAEPKKPAGERHSNHDSRAHVEELHSRIGNKRSYPNFSSDSLIADGGFTKLFATANPMLNQDQIWHLFDIVPSMEFCDVRYDGDRAHIELVYKNSQWAAYAKQKFHGFEYPPGHRLIVRSEFEENLSSEGYSSKEPNRDDILKLAETLVQATSQLKRSGRNSDLSDILQPLLTGSSSRRSFSPDRRGSSSTREDVDLPDPKPLVTDAEMRARCFIVCFPKPLPSNVLKDLFCRFGNLIDVYLLKGKHFGYAMYASELSATNAIRGLHGFEYHGVKLKVVEAEDRPDQHKRVKLN